MTDTRTKHSPPVHSALKNLSVHDDELVFAGKKITDLARIAGQTPFYAYDTREMSSRVQLLRDTLPDFVHLHFAMKANPLPAVVAHFAQTVDGLDVASAGELEIALESGMPAEKISFAGPGKRVEELRAAISAGIVINCESVRELERIDVLGSQLGVSPHVALRVNPDFELKTSGMKMGGGPKQFGIDAEEIPNVLRRVGKLGMRFAGFHVFSGSQNLKPEAICEAQRNTVELAVRLSESAPAPVEILNIGGGFGIPYFPGEPDLDIAPIAANLADLEPKIRAAIPNAEVVIELGRYLAGPAGIYVAKVLDQKVSRGETFLVVDGGLNHHLAATGNFGQFIRKNYPVVVGNRVESTNGSLASVVGPLCTPLDVLADKMELGHADVDDLIVVLQSGAYGYTASPHAFLSQPDAVEICL